MVDLSAFTIEPHPTQSIFKRHKIPLAILGKALDLSPHYVSGILNGSVPCTPPNDTRLRALADQLENEVTL